MLKLLTPHMQIESVRELQPALLSELRIAGLLLDLDCTLKDHYSGMFRPEIVRWVEQLNAAGVSLCILSNAPRRRVSPLAQQLGLACIWRAAKPLIGGLRAGLAKLQVDPTQAAIVGDQIFADVLAGRLAGIFTILVQPTTRREPFFTHIKRPLERLVLLSIARTNDSKARTWAQPDVRRGTDRTT